MKTKGFINKQRLRLALKGDKVLVAKNETVGRSFRDRVQHGRGRGRELWEATKDRAPAGRTGAWFSHLREGQNHREAWL